jgi:hypothetical protein
MGPDKFENLLTSVCLNSSILPLSYSFYKWDQFISHLLGVSRIKDQDSSLNAE